MSVLLRNFVTSRLTRQCRFGSTWRDPDSGVKEAWPNYKPQIISSKHRRANPITDYGIQSKSKLRVIDNSEVGRTAMANQRPPYVIRVNSSFHRNKKNGQIGKLGDTVVLAVLGEIKYGVLTGLKVKQKPGVPRFDCNNVVLTDKNGAPLGTRIHAPIPLKLKEILKKKTIAKKTEYVKILSIATKFV